VAPIDQEAEPATAGRARKPAEVRAEPPPLVIDGADPSNYRLKKSRMKQRPALAGGFFFCPKKKRPQRRGRTEADLI
jgi:hypothetical protein